MTSDQLIDRLIKRRKAVAARKADAIPHAERQRFVDLMFAGKTLGEAMLEIGVDDIEVGCELLNRQIQTIRHLAREVAS